MLEARGAGEARGFGFLCDSRCHHGSRVELLHLGFLSLVVPGEATAAPAVGGL